MGVFVWIPVAFLPLRGDKERAMWQSLDRMASCFTEWMRCSLAAGPSAAVLRAGSSTSTKTSEDAGTRILACLQQTIHASVWAAPILLTGKRPSCIFLIIKNFFIVSYNYFNMLYDSGADFAVVINDGGVMTTAAPSSRQTAALKSMS
jgi:hypothetical protein